MIVVVIAVVEEGEGTMRFFSWMIGREGVAMKKLLLRLPPPITLTLLVVNLNNYHHQP
jgi:hypothetical protein